MILNGIKIYVVGDDSTKLCRDYHRDCLPHQEQPAIFNGFSINTMFNGSPVVVKLVDAAPFENFENIRKREYPAHDAVIVASSLTEGVIDTDSSRMAEATENARPKTPLVLVGTYNQDVPPSERNASSIASYTRAIGHEPPVSYFESPADIYVAGKAKAAFDQAIELAIEAKLATPEKGKGKTR